MLVALDGSAEAERILSVLPVLCAGRFCRVTLARIAPPESIETPLELARSYLERLASGQSEPTVRFVAAARSGPVAESLLALAREAGASLLLASTFGDHRGGRMSPGAVLSQLIARSPIPLLLANPLVSFGTVGRLLIVAESGDPDLSALLPAAQFAAALDLDVVLLRLVPPGSTGRQEAEFRATAEDSLGRVSRWLEERGGVVSEILIEEGDPAERIPEAARQKEAALIALSGPDGVTRAILERSPVPVLLPAAPGSVPAPD
jgi:nucleotide-binding universal stress UspA family protein